MDTADLVTAKLAIAVGSCPSKSPEGTSTRTIVTLRCGANLHGSRTFARGGDVNHGELWTSEQVRVHLGYTTTAAARRWIAAQGLVAVRRDLSTGAKLYDSDAVKAAPRPGPGRPRQRGPGGAADGPATDGPATDERRP